MARCYYAYLANDNTPLTGAVVAKFTRKRRLLTLNCISGTEHCQSWYRMHIPGQ